MNKKICFLMPKHWSAFMGGAQFQARCIVEELARDNNLSLHFVAKAIDCSFVDSNYERHKIIGFPFAPFRALYLDYPFIYKAFRLINPDVIYQRVGGAYTGFAARYALKNKKRMVWHVAHDDDVTRPDCEHKTVHLNKVSRFLLEYGLKNASAIIVQTNTQAELLEKHYGRVADAVVPNFHPMPKRNREKDVVPTIVWVANFKPWKKPEMFISLADKLQHLGIRHQCLMVGAPSSNAVWQKELEEKIERIPTLSYLGQLPLDEVNRLLSRSHIFVNTSLAEGFANTFIQSWMRKVPVVSMYCNPDNVFDEKKVGFYCSGNVDDAVNYIFELICDELRMTTVGDMCRSYALKHHTLINIDRIKEIMLSS